MLINEHFAKERRMVRAYKILYYLSVPALELCMLGFTVYIVLSGKYTQINDYHAAFVIDAA